jgi:hypothetical protein
VARLDSASMTSWSYVTARCDAILPMADLQLEEVESCFGALGENRSSHLLGVSSVSTHKTSETLEVHATPDARTPPTEAAAATLTPLVLPMRPSPTEAAPLTLTPLVHPTLPPTQTKSQPKPKKPKPKKPNANGHAWMAAEVPSS